MDILIDRQLRSLQGLLEEFLTLKTFFQSSIRIDGHEEMLIEAIDKCHFGIGLANERASRVVGYYLCGFTEQEIAAQERVNQSTISRILKKNANILKKCA